MVRRRDAELKPRLQVGLIEAWEGQARVHRHEQRVDVFASVIAILIPNYGGVGRRTAGLEIHRDRVLAAFEMARGQDDVAARLSQAIHSRTIGRDTADHAFDDASLLVKIAEIA